MKLVIRVTAIVYHFYLHQNRDIPHFRTIVTLFGFAFLVYINIALAFDFPIGFVAPLDEEGDTKAVKFFKVACIFTPILILLSVLLNKRRIINTTVKEEEVESAGKIIPIAFFTLLALLVIQLVLRGMRLGTL